MPKDNWTKLIELIKTNARLTDDLKAACLAQAILESGRGTSKVAHECLNFWGMKMRAELAQIATGKDVKVTSEVSGTATFACFEALDKALLGWQVFLTREPYKGWERYKNDAIGFINHISVKWCPRNDYAAKVISLLPEAKGLLNQRPRKHILLDPGHSKAEPGARSNNGSAKEEDLNLIQAKEIQRLLADDMGVDIFNPEVDDLEQIGQKARGYDAFISLHHNSYDGDKDPGTEAFIATNPKPASVRLAGAINEFVSEALGTTNRGVIARSFTVIRNAEMVCKGPVVLSESYFLNGYDAATAKERSLKAAAAIAKAIRFALK